MAMHVERCDDARCQCRLDGAHAPHWSTAVDPCAVPDVKTSGSALRESDPPMIAPSRVRAPCLWILALPSSQPKPVASPLRSQRGHLLELRIAQCSAVTACVFASLGNAGDGWDGPQPAPLSMGRLNTSRRVLLFPTSVPKFLTSLWSSKAELVFVTPTLQETRHAE